MEVTISNDAKRMVINATFENRLAHYLYVQMLSSEYENTYEIIVLIKNMCKSYILTHF